MPGRRSRRWRWRRPAASRVAAWSRWKEKPHSRRSGDDARISRLFRPLETYPACSRREGCGCGFASQGDLARLFPSGKLRTEDRAAAGRVGEADLAAKTQDDLLDDAQSQAGAAFL